MEVKNMTNENKKNNKEQSTQPKPMSGSHKVKNENHSKQNKHSSHDM